MVVVCRNGMAAGVCQRDDVYQAGDFGEEMGVGAGTAGPADWRRLHGITEQPVAILSSNAGRFPWS